MQVCVGTLGVDEHVQSTRDGDRILERLEVRGHRPLVGGLLRAADGAVMRPAHSDGADLDVADVGGVGRSKELPVLVVRALVEQHQPPSEVHLPQFRR